MRFSKIPSPIPWSVIRYNWRRMWCWASCSIGSLGATNRAPDQAEHAVHWWEDVESHCEFAVRSRRGTGDWRMASATISQTSSPVPTGRPGRFGAYGGRYVPETLMAALEELENAYAEAQA